MIVSSRFLQPDPMDYYYSMNLYEYCWNNPTNWIDPWGLFGMGIGVGFGGGSLEGGTGGFQFVFDSHGGMAVFVHAGRGMYWGEGGSVNVDFSAFTGTVEQLNGFFTSTGGSAQPGAVWGGEFNSAGPGGPVGATFNVGIGGGIPVEAHHFVEWGESLRANFIFKFWGDVAKKTWGGIKSVFKTDSSKDCPDESESWLEQIGWDW